MSAKPVVLALALSLGSTPALAESVMVTDQNASLKFTTDDLDRAGRIGSPSDPLQFPRTIEWTVEGRRILVYPSVPLTFLDIAHLHSSGHVATNQVHAQGPMLGYATGATTGTVTGGIVYTVNGDATGSGAARITEKVDIANKGSGTVPLNLSGMGWKPPENPAHGPLEIPDLSGLNITGTTTVFIQAGSITDGPPYAPVTVLPVAAFSGFNPFRQNVDLPAGSTLTMITELKLVPNTVDIGTAIRDPGSLPDPAIPELVRP